MQSTGFKAGFSRFMNDYGMLFVLLVLVAAFSVATLDKQEPEGEAAAEDLAGQIDKVVSKGGKVLVVSGESDADLLMVESLRKQLEELGYKVVGSVSGDPIRIRAELVRLAKEGAIDVIATTRRLGTSPLLAQVKSGVDIFKPLGQPRVLTPQTYYWPNLLTKASLITLSERIVIYAIIGIGMTMVIITAGIDLSVGSIIALSAVVTAVIMRDLFGGVEAGMLGMIVGTLGGILVGAAIGCFTGTMVTFFGVAPFIVTLGMMFFARGLAGTMTGGFSISMPPSFKWLGLGSIDHGFVISCFFIVVVFVCLGWVFKIIAALNEGARRKLAGGRSTWITGISALALGVIGGITMQFSIPVGVLLMMILYVGAHLLMTRTTLGRYIYAVGGNAEAARLSGVRVKWVLMFVYTLTGALAGLGGVIIASKHTTGVHTYGNMYELYVIAAVVIGGTSLMGGEGKIMGTMIGALIMAVIGMGMNLMGADSFTQQVVIGLVLLAAVFLDTVKQRGWRFFER